MTAVKKKKATKKKAVKKKLGVATGTAVAIATPPLEESSLSSNALAAFANYDAANFAGVELDVVDNKELFNNDIVVPKIWLIQSMSELRIEKKKEEGDYVNSRTEETLLEEDSENYLPLIVIKTFKRWQTFKMEDDKKVFISSEIMKLGVNDKYEYEDVLEGEDIFRRQVISAYVLLGEDAQKGVVKPYVIDFASTSKGAGRDMVSDIKVLNVKKLPSYVCWFKLGKVIDKKDKNQWYVKTMKFGGSLPNEMMGFLKGAYDDITSMIDANAIEIDDRDVRDAAKAATATEIDEKAPSQATTDAGI